MVTEQAYNVRDGELVAEKLRLDFNPVGLYVEDMGSEDLFVVEVIPRTDQDQLQVSQTVLKELVDADAIEVKDS